MPLSLTWHVNSGLLPHIHILVRILPSVVHDRQGQYCQPDAAAANGLLNEV